MAEMNPTQIFQIMRAWQKFTENHPKFPKFIRAVAAEGVQEGTVMELTITTPEGKEYCTNLKVQQEDLELLAQLRAMMP